MKPKVYITRRIPDTILEKISSVCDVRMWDKEDVPVPRDILLKEIKDADGIFSMLTENIDKEALNQAENLKVIANMAVGYNNIDVAEAKNKDIVVTNTPGVLTETTADLTFALLMTTARRIIESSAYLRNGEWKTWSPMQLTGQDIYGANLGIIGMGRIGQAVAKRAKGFDMNVCYYNRSRKPEIEHELGITYSDFDILIAKSDFICILVPYSPDVYHLIGQKELENMKENAILINTARGGIIDETALYDALQNDVIRAAGLDVFEKEPISIDHPLLTLPNVVTLPHIGSASVNTRYNMADLTAENLIKTLSGKEPVTPV